MELFTVGYEGVQLPDLIDTLRVAGIEQIIDVRRVPLSRKKGFSKSSLSAALNLEGFEYFHLRDLGCPQFIRQHYKKHNDWDWYERHYEAFLDNNEELLMSLIALAETAPSCLMCFEADPIKCHRRLIASRAQKMSGEEFPIRHLFPGRKYSFKTRQVGFHQSCFAF